MTIGVGVEGPSDRAFWNKVLPKYFPVVRFDIRNMKNCSNLIQQAPQLMETFRDLHYRAGYILLDYDKVFRTVTACPGAVIEEFDGTIQEEGRKPWRERFLFVCVAVRGLESWCLADEGAIKAVLPNVTYSSPEETGNLDGNTLENFWRQEHHTSFNKIDFAKRVAPKFRPEVAMVHSISFRHLWERISARAAS